MSRDVVNRFKKNMVENKLINKGDKIVIGLSGGPDSICLLNLLCEIREEFDLDLAAAHINHMIRGEEADEDQEFCRERCLQLGVKFFYKKIDVNAYAKNNGLSSESAGREIRYGFFDEVMNKLKFNKIATAHNANDQAETVLMRLMRGTGLEGLSGIQVIRDKKYIRPILFLNRDEVEKYCHDIGEKARIDKTNLERLYSRNRIRLDILPYMKEHFNKDIVDTINRMAQLIDKDNEFINKMTEKYYNNVCIEDKEKVIIKKDGFSLESSIITRIIRKSIYKVGNAKYNVEAKHIEDVIKLQKNSTSKILNLPNKVIAENVYGDIHIKRTINNGAKKSCAKCIDKNDLKNITIEFGEYLIDFEVINNEKKLKFNDNSLIKYFNYDNINNEIKIRFRKDGDKIVPFGMKGSKKLKDIFIDMKVPKEQRDSIPIILFDDNISWIVGMKMSEIYRVTNDAKKILKIKVTRKE